MTFTSDCFDPDSPTDPDWDDVDDDFDPADLTGHHRDGWEADPRFRVATDSVERAADALLVVADRFMNVGHSGNEYVASSAADPGDYTPSSSHVSADDEAAYVWADTQGGLTHEMAATMKRILVEELARVEVSALISADYQPVRGTDAQRWPRPRG